jgi:SAM-dependent methyltransferase/TusA-related sulfurtransferase
MYTTVAREPEAEFHFPIGRRAAALAGYSDELLHHAPKSALESFAGVGCPFEAAVIRAGDTVLDVGSGSGTDAFIAGALTGPNGRVLALDVTRAMLERLVRTAEQTGALNVDGLLADAEAIPLPDASVDVVTSNGALNLVLDKRRAFAELFRVLRPGGRLQLADIVLGKPVTDSCRADPRLWVECVVGATLEPTLFDLLRSAGFADIELLRRLEYFAASPSADTREIAAALNARAIVLRARRPALYNESTRFAEGDDRAPEPDDVLEAYGQTCVSLEPLIKKRMRAMQSGQVLEVRADDPTARVGIPSWCRLSGNTLLATIQQEGGRTRFFLRRK